MSMTEAPEVVTRPAGLAERLGLGGRRGTPLLPDSSLAGRALIIVIIIMAFLASITAGTVQLIAQASSDWTGTVAREMTVQVRPRSGRDLEADVRRAADIAGRVPGITEVRIFTRAEAERLLEPWLGAGLALGELPVPRLIVLRLDPAGQADVARLKGDLGAVPTASLDDHRLWLKRLATMARTLVVIGLVVMALVLVAMALAVAFATRGAMAGNREIIDVLHLVGAEDRFIAREFQRHFLKLGLRGGAIGGGLAVLAFLLASSLSQRWIATPGGEQVEALFGSFALGFGGYAAVAVIAGLVAAITAVVSRTTVFRNLRGLD
ncbi:MAG TPA: ABC transporter permease [Beijerinckiaceae bacterium]|nr:ABC transporter permease [Beijerinckiaceae bacterium]